MIVKYFDYAEVTSTNDIALEKIKEYEDNNILVVVTAQNQTKGRGRNNKIWYGNQQQNLYYTCGFKHSTKDVPMSAIQIIGGLAAYNLISDLLGAKNMRLKYPNDIYVLDNLAEKNNPPTFKKIVGVIAEHNYSYHYYCESIIGIGINNKQEIFPDIISHNATSLAQQCCNISNEELKLKLTDIIIKLLHSDINEIFDL
jgi:BirA family biotin operon repressor/biotin-[acetyl-CoA-carboxylase] ligase